MVLGNSKFEDPVSVALIKCILCEEEGGLCEFSRQKFAFGLYENQLHIFGGTRQGEVLNDINIIDIGKGQIHYH